MLPSRRLSMAGPMQPQWVHSDLVLPSFLGSSHHLLSTVICLPLKRGHWCPSTPHRVAMRPHKAHMGAGVSLSPS